MIEQKERFHTGIFIAMLSYSIGILYLITNCVGIFYVPVSTALGMDRGLFSTYYSVQSIAAMITLFFSGKIIQRYQKQLKLILVLASLVIFGGYALFATGTSLAHFYAGGILIGAGLGFCSHMVIASIINNWFKLKTGTILSVVVTCPSVIGIFVNPILTEMIETRGYQMVYWVIGIGMLIFTVPAALFLIRYTPEDAGKLPYGAAAAAKAAEESTETAVSTASVSYRTAIKSPSFWLIFFFTFAAVAWANFIQILPGFAADAGLTGAAIGQATSWMLVGSIVAKIALGTLSDRIGPVKAAGLMTLLGVIGMCMMIFTSPENAVLFYAGIVLYGLGQAVLGVVPPIVCRAAFGLREYSAIYGNISTGIWIGTAVVIPMFNFAFDLSGSYVVSMIIAIALFLLGQIALMAGVKMAQKLPRD